MNMSVSPKIFAFLPGRALGDFAIAAVMASSIRDQFDEGELFIYYRDDRPYKKFIAECIRNRNGTFVSNAEFAKSFIPIDFFDPPGGRMMSNNEVFEQNRLKDSNLVLCGSMLSEGGLNSIPLTRLVIPPERVSPSDSALLSLGVDPSRWIATVYWKEPGYKFRWPDPKRLIFDPTPYIAMITHIVRKQGGQVIRLGHPTDVNIPQMDGYFDLAKVSGTEWLQLYAVTVSRYFVGSASGPASYGPAFGVPSANTDQTLCLGVWNNEDYIVSQGVQYDGKIFNQLEAFDAGYLFQEWKPDKPVHYIRNTAEQLVHAADEMFKITQDVSGWRRLTLPDPPKSRSNTICLPIPRKYRRDLMIPPTLRGR